MHAPAAIAAVPLVAGAAAAAVLWPELPEAVSTTGCGAAALALIAALALHFESDDGAVAVALGVGWLLAGVALGALAAGAAYAPPLLAWHLAKGGEDPASLEGRLREDAASTARGTALVVDVERADGHAMSGGVRLSVAGVIAPAAALDWTRGRRVRVRAHLRLPAAHRNPGVPDEVRALARRGICLVGSVKSGALVEVLAQGSALEEASARARAWVRRRVAAAVAPLSVRGAAVTTAILIGDRSRLDEEDERRLQEAGTYHVIAISGGNIAIAAAMLTLLARILFLPPPAAAAVSIVLLLLYGEIAGPAPSVRRAIGAAVLFFAARMWDHRGSASNALSIAAIGSVAIAPLCVLDAGFILSFGATAGLILGMPRLLPRPKSRVRGLKRVFRFLLRAAAAVPAGTLCAEIALLPAGATLFGRVTVAGFVLNFAAIPLMTVVQLSGIGVLATPASWAGGLGLFVAGAAGGAGGLLSSAGLIDLAPWMSIRVAPPAWPLLTAYYASVIALLSPRCRIHAAALCAATIALIVAGPAALAAGAVPHSGSPVRVVVLDVGQADSTLVQTPRHSILVDAAGVPTFSPGDETGPGFDVGERVVAPALRALGVSRLDHLVLTHGDPDHVLGAPTLLRLFHVRSVSEGVPVPRHAGLATLRRLAASRGTSWRTVQRGDRESFDEVEVRVLHPPPPAWERQRVRNDDSIVLDIRLGNVSVVLAGDIGREGEHAILSALDPGRLTVLKAGHHGSATSSTPEFLAALRPVAVIFSAGRSNRFGHPHPAVVARFEAMGTAIFRTDRDGAVIVETNGERVEIRGWTGRSVVAGLHDRRRMAGPGTTVRRHDDTK